MNGPLEQLLDAQLGAGLGAFDAEEFEIIDVGDLVAPGLGRSQSLTELAELLSGTSDKKSKAYKTARRNAERWAPKSGKKPRQPTVRSRRRIGGARRQQDARLAQFRRHGGEMRVKISWYGSRAPEWLPPHRWQHIRQRQMRKVVSLWAEGEHELAAEELFFEFLDQYGVPNPLDWLADTEIIDLRLIPSEPK